MSDSGVPTRTSGRRKRLGQFFTGAALARLLTELADVAEAGNLIDPMVGSGDMIAAAVEAGFSGLAAGVDIDPDAIEVCRRRCEDSRIDGHFIAGNAFSCEVLSQLPLTSWDVVITNPPYVRYQIGAAEEGELSLPAAADVRRHLLKTLSWLETEQDFPLPTGFHSAASSYSGLSDLAVPSWILCAALTRPGRVLAMVVPDTWLSRDYAKPIRDLLHQEFELQAVIRDGDASWFDDALVRTTLVLAVRLDGRRARRAGYPVVTLRRAARSEVSVTGGVFPESACPDRTFAAWLRSIGTGDHDTPRDLSVAWHDYRDASEGPAGGASLPSDIVGALEGALDPGSLSTLAREGWRVGQGLRTGANDFFYVTEVADRDASLIVRTSDLLGAVELALPRELLRPAVRRQSDLRGAFAARSAGSSILLLAGYAIPEDIAAASRAGIQSSQIPLPLPEALSALIRRAEKINLGTESAPKFFPDLSAVRTNVRSLEKVTPTAGPRYWYQLPLLALRHTPDLMLARINAATPMPRLNEGRRLTVDANFNTLWRVSPDGLDAHGMMALLASSWSAAFLECAGTVLGGGALKIEAALLRRLPIPDLRGSARRRLSDLGGALLHEGTMPAGLQQDIDRTVLSGLIAEGSQGAGERLRELAMERVAMRSSRAHAS